MTVTDPNTVGATPWYKSPVLISLLTAAVSAIIARFPKIGELVGISDSASAQAAVSGFFGIVAIIAPMVGSILRVKSKIQPLTINTARAENHPATQVAAARDTGAAPPVDHSVPNG